MTDKTLIALDFDGVVCDSARESSISAWRALQIAEVIPSQAPVAESFISSFLHARPAILDTFELMILGYLLYRGKDSRTLRDDFAAEVAKAREAESEGLLSLSRETLIRIFGEARDEWFARDAGEWLAANRIYPEAEATLRSWHQDTKVELHIVTKKLRRFTQRILLNEGLELPQERIFAGEDGSKLSYLRRLATDRSAPPSLHFVEDRLATLEKVVADPKLRQFTLHLASWGYVTEADLQRGNRMERVRVLDGLGEL